MVDSSSSAAGICCVVRRENIEVKDESGEFFCGAAGRLFRSLVTAGTSATGTGLAVGEAVGARDAAESPVKVMPMFRFHQLEFGAVVGGKETGREVVDGRVKAIEDGGESVVGRDSSTGAAETEIVGSSGADSNDVLSLTCSPDFLVSSVTSVSSVSPVSSVDVDVFVAAGPDTLDASESRPSSSSFSLTLDPSTCMLSSSPTGTAGTELGGRSLTVETPCEGPELSMTLLMFQPQIERVKGGQGIVPGR